MVGNRLYQSLAVLLVLFLVFFSHLSAGGHQLTKDGLVLKRRDTASAEELRKQLIRFPEVGLDQPAAKLLYAFFERQKDNDQPDLGPTFLVQVSLKLRQPERSQLPWRTGPDCQLGKETAEVLHVLSVALRNLLRESVPRGDVRPDVAKLRKLLFEPVNPSEGTSIFKRPNPEQWEKPEAVPTLVQMLQVENEPIRELMVEMLGKIKGKSATIALAQRALFELSAEVREKAVIRLKARPDSEYKQTLIDGLRHPWSPVADHAAEALVALKMKESAPALVALLKEPDPKRPFIVEVKNKNVYHVKELVRMNHMCNCMVCHAPSLGKNDLVRGLVPKPGEDPPPLYYTSNQGDFVRANTTFLHQDFSVVQPVPQPGKWPANQRFDYLLRTRPLSKMELANLLRKKEELPASYEQREAVLFALRGITGKDAGTKNEAWNELLKGIRKERE
jgi:hypothetical protein